MQRKKKGVLAVSAVLVVAMLTSLAGCKKTDNGNDKKVYKIGIVQLVEHPALDAAYKGFKEELAAKGYKDGDNIQLDFKNAQNDTNTLNTIASQFVGDKKDLILAIATPSAQAVASQTKDIPIVGTAITDYVAAKLAKTNAKPGSNITGTSDMNPVAKQIDLGCELVPTAKVIGLIYNSSEANSIVQINLAKKEIAAKGLTTKEVTVTNVNDVPQAMQSLVASSDFIYLPTDNTLASAMQTVSSVANTAKVPVICGEPNMVNNGGLATIGIDYEELGKMTGDMAIKILKGAKPADTPIQFATSTPVTINADGVKALGITVPDKYKADVVAPQPTKE